MGRRVIKRRRVPDVDGLVEENRLTIWVFGQDVAIDLYPRRVPNRVDEQTHRHTVPHMRGPQSLGDTAVMAVVDSLSDARGKQVAGRGAVAHTEDPAP